MLKSKLVTQVQPENKKSNPKESSNFSLQYKETSELRFVKS